MHNGGNMRKSEQITPLERQLLRIHPEHRPVAVFGAALPLYRLRLAARVLVPQAIPPIAQYVLRAIAEGRNTPAALSDLLGIGAREVDDACADLLTLDLIDLSQPDASGHRSLRLSDRGEARITTKAPTSAPQKWWFDLHYEPLGGRLFPRQEDVRQAKGMRDSGVFVLPHAGPPSLGSLHPEQVHEALRMQEGKVQAVLALLEMNRPALEYRTGITVVVLRAGDDESVRLAVFAGARHLAVTSEGLEHLHRRGAAVMPRDIVAELQTVQ